MESHCLLTDGEVFCFSKLMRSVGPKLAILVSQVDPDSIGGALGLAAIARHFGIEPEIYYAAFPGHPQSQLIWRVWKLGEIFRPIAQLPDCVPVALVDSHQRNDRRFGVDASRIPEPVIMIDHHVASKSTLLRQIRDDTFAYIVKTGAASSLIVHLALFLGVEIDEATATLLLAGIYTDTLALTHVDTTAFDWMMAARIRTYASQQGFYDINMFPMSERCCTVIQNVMNHRRFVEDVAFPSGQLLIAHPGADLDPGESEYLMIAADLLWRHEEAALVIVWGAVGGPICIKARTRNNRMPLDRMLKLIFGEDSAGAKPGSGGAWYTPDVADTSSVFEATIIGWLAKVENTSDPVSG